jgi:hypothetical protein
MSSSCGFILHPKDYTNDNEAADYLDEAGVGGATLDQLHRSRFLAWISDTADSDPWVAAPCKADIRRCQAFYVVQLLQFFNDHDSSPP